MPGARGLSRIPDQCRHRQDIDKGNGKPDENTKVFDALFAEGIKNDGHADIGIEPVTALGKGACLVVGYVEQFQRQGADDVGYGNGHKDGNAQIPVYKTTDLCAPDFPEKQHREKNKIDQSVG